MNVIFRIMTIVLLMAVAPVSAGAQATPESSSGSDGPPAFAKGLNTPATFIDERGNPVFEISVTEVERDWQDYTEYYPPERGMEYVLVSVRITNLTSREAEILPYMISMIDSTGLVMNQAFATDSPDVWYDNVPVGAGETVEGGLLFSMYMDMEPLMLMWQPEYTTYIFVYLSEQ